MPPVKVFTERKSQDLRGRRKLSIAQLDAIRVDGRHPLDELLYFTVQRGGTSRMYELRYLSPETGKRRDMSLGRFPDIEPAHARNLAADARALLARGVDPLEERRREAEKAKTLKASGFTLRDALLQHYDIEKARWRNEKYRSQWLPRMHAALGPLLDSALVSIRKKDLHDLLVELNRDNHDAAIKARANLDKVYRRYSGTHGIPESLNPAAALTGLLPRTNSVKHHPALKWRKAPEFMRKLRDSNTWVAVRLGFEWMVLSGARTNAVTHARWEDIDRAGECWHAKPDEAENKRRGDVPLTPRMLEILEAMKPHRVPGSAWIFPSQQRQARSKHRKDRGHPPISNEAFRQVLGRMKLSVTGHGFRSTFKTWAVESPQGRKLQIPEAVIEAALGHSERDAIRAAYTRADYWAQRVELASAWHDFLLNRE